MRSPARVQVSTPLAGLEAGVDRRAAASPSQSTCALASVACPQSGTSTAGVNQRRPKSAPGGSHERGLGQVHLRRHGLHPRRVGRRVEQADRGRVAAERGFGERVDDEERGAHGVRVLLDDDEDVAGADGRRRRARGSRRRCRPDSRLMWFSIFIASSTSSAWPASTDVADVRRAPSRSCPASAR